MRVKSKRFPTIEKDMKMVLAHCGSLFLDPASLMQVLVQCSPQIRSAIHDLRVSACAGSVHICLACAVAEDDWLRGRGYS